jgi:hypothetical protein
MRPESLSSFPRLVLEPKNKASVRLLQSSTKESISVLVIKGALPGQFATLSLAGKIFQARAEFQVFPGEVLTMNQKELEAQAFKLRQRSFAQGKIQPDSSENTRTGFYSPSLHRRETMEELIDKFFQKSTAKKDEPVEEKLLQSLSKIFSFLDWNLETLTFSWDWNFANAKAYYSESEDKKCFLLQYSSESLGSARFLFYFEQTDVNWDLRASFETMSFYEIFVKNYKELEDQYRLEFLMPNSFLAEYVPDSIVEETRGWVA